MIEKIGFRILFLFLLLFPLLALFHSGLPSTHDGQDHVVRIANFYKNLTEGNIIPRWAGNLNWGYGHPILEFLYPLPSYLASFFHFIGFTFVDSVKIVFALGMFLSLIFMYLWLSQFLSKYSSLFGAILYTYAPYRFVELYVRGDIGENLAFAFIPLVLFFSYKIYKHSRFSDTAFGAISLALLILSHNAISLMVLPFIFIYLALLIYLSKDKMRVIINLGFLILMGFGLASFFWIPALLEGRYTLRNIVTKGEYLKRFISLKELLYGSWSYGIAGQFTVQLGLFAWISLIFSPFILLKFKKNKEKYYLSIILLIFSILAIFFMLPISSFVWSRILLLQNFQFPWRFLAIVVFSTAVLGALLAEVISSKFRLKSILLSIFIAIAISSFYSHPKGYTYNPERFYTGIYNSTTDTGESAPIWSVRFMEKRPKANLEIIDGYASIKNLQRTSTYHKYKIIVDKNTLFRENTLYFPGWEIKANGKNVNIEFQNITYRGIMTFRLSPGNYILEAKYKETKLRIFSDVVSLVSLGNISVGLFLIFLIKIRSKRYN